MCRGEESREAGWHAFGEVSMCSRKAYYPFAQNYHEADSTPCPTSFLYLLNPEDDAHITQD
jgi:hypothetical protein